MPAVTARRSAAREIIDLKNGERHLFLRLPRTSVEYALAVLADSDEFQVRDHGDSVAANSFDAWIEVEAGTRRTIAEARKALDSLRLSDIINRVDLLPKRGSGRTQAGQLDLSAGVS